MGTDWHGWHREYDDPTSSLSRRLEVVRSHLGALVDRAAGPVRLVSMCCGDGRDTLPVIARARVPVQAVLVELDEVLAEDARRSARDLGLTGVEVRTADAGTTDSYAGCGPADLLLACGVFGNVADDDVTQTIATLPSFLAAGAQVLWTRGRGVPADPDRGGDAADHVRGLLAGGGFEEVAFVRPDDAEFRVGVHRWPGPAGSLRPGVRMFSFV